MLHLETARTGREGNFYVFEKHARMRELQIRARGWFTLDSAAFVRHIFWAAKCPEAVEEGVPW